MTGFLLGFFTRPYSIDIPCSLRCGSSLNATNPVAPSTRTVQVECLSNEVVEINAERRSEITAVGKGGISWCGFFDRKGFARNGNFRSVGASESSGYLRLVIGCEEAQTVDGDVLAGVPSANGNDEVDVTRFSENYS